MITYVSIFSPIATLLFMVAAVVIHKRIQNTRTRALLILGIVMFCTDLLVQYFINSMNAPIVEETLMEDSMRSRVNLMTINGYAHVAAFIGYAGTLIWIFTGLRPTESGTKQEA